MKFETTEDEDRKVKDWYDSIKPRIMEKVRERFKDENTYNQLTHNGKHPYYGSISLGLKYTIIPTGIGTITKVEEFYTKEILDLTDYDSW